LKLKISSYWNNTAKQ